jgi:AraC-like DNA-binding protein
LACPGVSCETLRDEVRKETAERSLAETKLSMGELAYLLGYSEAAAFHRAFKRWTAMTPQRYGQTRRLADATSRVAGSASAP